MPSEQGSREAVDLAVKSQAGPELPLTDIRDRDSKSQVAPGLPPTDIRNPDYFHKVVDCQWACPAHTPVPEYIRLIAAGRYTDAYLVNWRSNVFPGILGRTCDRPCEPACRRGRVEAEPVAICRLKRVAADNKEDVGALLPKAPSRGNGRRIALIGAGPASLTVARDLAPLGYEIVLFDGEQRGGGMIRSQIPRFRLPEEVIDEEVDYITGMGDIKTRYGERVGSLRAVLAGNFDAVFVGTGAPRGRDLDVPGRREGAANIHIGIDWLANVSFGHIDRIGRRVVVLGGGNTAMDCCRTARRLGGEDVKVVVRSGFEEMKASPWEKEDTLARQATHYPNPILHASSFAGPFARWLAMIAKDEESDVAKSELDRLRARLNHFDAVDQIEVLLAGALCGKSEKSSAENTRAAHSRLLEASPAVVVHLKRLGILEDKFSLEGLAITQAI
jgi:hypothetical protein